MTPAGRVPRQGRWPRTRGRRREWRRAGQPRGWLAASRPGRAGRRVPRHLRHHPVRLTASVAMTRRGAATSPTAASWPFAASGDWLLITLGWGFARRLRGLRRGRRLRRAPEPGGHARPGAAPRLPVEEGPDLLGRAGVRRVRRRRARLLQLPLRDLGRSRPRTRSPAARRTRSRRSRIFATFPAPYFTSLVRAVHRPGDRHRRCWSLFIFAVIDEYNAPVKANLAPLDRRPHRRRIGISFGANAGYAINPARDLGPRIFAWIEGWKADRDAGRLRQRQHLHVDPDRRAADRRRASAPTSTTT